MTRNDSRAEPKNGNASSQQQHQQQPRSEVHNGNQLPGKTRSAGSRKKTTTPSGNNNMKKTKKSRPPVRESSLSPKLLSRGGYLQGL